MLLPNCGGYRSTGNIEEENQSADSTHGDIKIAKYDKMKMEKSLKKQKYIITKLLD